MNIVRSKLVIHQSNTKQSSFWDVQKFTFIASCKNRHSYKTKKTFSASVILRGRLGIIGFSFPNSLKDFSLSIITTGKGTPNLCFKVIREPADNFVSRNTVKIPSNSISEQNLVFHYLITLTRSWPVEPHSYS